MHRAQTEREIWDIKKWANNKNVSRQCEQKYNGEAAASVQIQSGVHHIKKFLMKRNPWTGRLPISLCVQFSFLSLRNTTQRTTTRVERGGKITESKACNKKQHVLSLFPEHKSFATFANVLVNREHRNRERANRWWWGHRGKTLNHRTAGGHGGEAEQPRKKRMEYTQKKSMKNQRRLLNEKNKVIANIMLPIFYFWFLFARSPFFAVFKRLSGASVKCKRFFGYLTCQMTVVM